MFKNICSFTLSNIIPLVYQGKIYVEITFWCPWQVGGFLRVLRLPPSIKTDRHDIAEILLKVVLNTITLNLNLLIIGSPTATDINKCIGIFSIDSFSFCCITGYSWQYFWSCMVRIQRWCLLWYQYSPCFAIT